MKRLLREHWLSLCLVGSIWALACIRLLVDPTPRLPLLFNWTGSLPYSVALLSGGDGAALQRGDHVLYRFVGATSGDRTLAGQPFLKIVAGLPGDRIEVVDRVVFLNGERVGVAKTQASDGRPLSPIAPGIIPQGSFFALGTAPDSFDSRYASSGLVRLEQVIGKVMPIW